ncbi:MAG TPA: RagB/SusD family nutrient uptake outer membrane protein [Puia sp.]|nr:RagB/SusD family nutrient uptake outer membrane protein [Puia sp.]
MRYTGLFLLPVCCLSACMKYLDKDPNPALSIPQTVQDYRALMDNDLITDNSTPGLGQLGSDDYMMSYAAWTGTDLIAHNAYIWQADVYGNEPAFPWSAPYQAIYYCNVVLDGLPGVAVHDSASLTEYNAVKGAALFTRAFQFYALEETFGQPYRAGSKDNDMGILLKLTSDAHQQVGRSTVRQVYDRILDDARKAAALLPAQVQLFNRNRPCKPAAFALLSRAFLSMQEYDSAKIYADSSLHYYDKLASYDTVNAGATRPFPPGGNDEVLYQCSAVNFKAQYSTSSEVDTTLYKSYADNDLRKTVFFKVASSGTGHYFRGQYTGKAYLFSGLATDEVYLTRAECYARMGMVGEALSDLNALLSRRWKTGTFQPYTASTADEALAMILSERRKETLFRELRWADLRRLNQGPYFLRDTLRRILNDSEYTLLPEDPRYTYPIPKEEIRLSGIEQNPR